MAQKRNWLVIILAIIGAIVVCLFVLAGAGAYMVARHITSKSSTATAAVKTFEDQRAQFNGQTPVIALDDLDSPEVVRKKLDALPTSTTPISDLHVLVWSPDSQRTVDISLPMWILKMGKRKMDFGSNSGVDFERYRIDITDIERIGPHLLVDLEKPGGERVLVWTK